MTWLTVMEYLCHKWPRICSTCRKYFPVLSSFTTYYRVYNLINTMGATSGAGTSYLSRPHELTPGFYCGSCYSIFSSICMLCKSLFVLLYFFFWPLFCLFFFNIRIMIAPLVSSNSSSRPQLRVPDPRFAYEKAQQRPSYLNKSNTKLNGSKVQNSKWLSSGCLQSVCM